MWRAPALALPLLCVALAAESAVLTPLSQSRGVSADTTVTRYYWLPTSNPFFPDFDPADIVQTFPNPQGEAAPAFDPFDESVTSTDVTPPLFDLLDASISASQTSEILSDRITASGSWAASLDADSTILPGPPLTPGNFAIDSSSGEGSSSFFSVTFHLDASARFELTGLLDHTLDPTNPPIEWVRGEAAARLTGPGGVIAEFDTQPVFPCDPIPACFDDPVPIDLAGTLVAGTYTLEASAGGDPLAGCVDVGGGLTCGMTTGDGSYQIELQLLPVPVPSVGPLGLVALGLGLVLTSPAVRRRSDRPASAWRSPR